MDKEKKYVIWGSSGHAKVLADIILQDGSTIDLLIDNDPKAISSISNIPLCSGVEGFNNWLNEKSHVQYLGVIAIGGTKGKDRLEIAKIFRNVGLKLPVIKHKTSVIALNSIVRLSRRWLNNFPAGLPITTSLMPVT